MSDTSLTIPTGAAKRRLQIVLAVLLTILVLTAFISMRVGQYPMSASSLLNALLFPLGWSSTPVDPQLVSVLWQIRLPRLVLGLVVGAALAVAGTVMQAIFANPLAEPGIIGISSGAAMGAAVAVVAFPLSLGGYAVPLSAFVGGTGAALTVYLLAQAAGRADAITLVLTGIAVTAVCGALTSIATYMAPTTARNQIVFWQMGSLNGATWTQVATVSMIVAIALLVALAMTERLDILILGEAAAGHVGVNVIRLRTGALILTALITAAAVSYAGIITFVGLIVPHTLRLIVGPQNRLLIPTSMLGGAFLIILADVLARTLVAYADLPIGIFTALIGGPTFFVLMRKHLRGRLHG